MKNCKKRLLVLIISVVSFFIIGFIFYSIITLRFYYYLETRPDSQENTTWYSEDGKIIIYIGEGNNQRISFEQDGVITECYFTSGRGYYATVYAVEALENNRLGLFPEEHYEVWSYTKVEKDYFTITVEKTKFLEVGDKITFHKNTGDG